MASVMSWLLITLGLLILLAGLLWPLFSTLGLGRLPGDIVVERGNSTFYVPLVTSILVSIVLTVLLNLALWLFGRCPLELLAPCSVTTRSEATETDHDLRSRLAAVASRDSPPDHSSAGDLLASLSP
jgi:hypothetical protein